MTAADTVIKYVREALFSGELKPREHLVESQLAQALGMSRTPVREALRKLEEVGLVESTPYRGCRIRDFSVEELEKLYQARRILESETAVPSAESPGPAFPGDNAGSAWLAAGAVPHSE